MATKKLIYFTDEMIDNLEMLQSKTGKKISELVREGLEELVTKIGEEPKMKSKPISAFANMSQEDLIAGTEIDAIKNRLSIIERKLGLVNEDGRRTILLGSDEE